MEERDRSDNQCEHLKHPIKFLYFNQSECIINFINYYTEFLVAKAYEAVAETMEEEREQQT